MRFSPTAAGTFVGNVTFTGGDNPSRSVSGVGAAANVAPDPPSALGQFKTDGTTALAVGAWTNQTSIVLKFTMVDATPADTLTPEVEIKPVGTAFTGAGLRAGTAVASTGAPVQGVVSVTGLTNGSQYHWRARTRDAAGQTSGWVSFGGNAETVRDVGVDTSAPSGSIVVASGSVWTKARTVNLSLTCTDTKSGCGQMQLAQDAGAFTPPEPFVANHAFTLAGADGKKTRQRPLHRRRGQRLEVLRGHDHARHHGARRHRGAARPRARSCSERDDDDPLPGGRCAVGHVSRGHPHPQRRRRDRAELQQERGRAPSPAP